MNEAKEMDIKPEETTTWFEKLTEETSDQEPDIDYITMLEEMEYR